MCLLFLLGYRLNKYCGQHLRIENESPDPEPEFPLYQRSVPSNNDIQRSERNGPIAEALIQNEQMFHSLKILKPSPSETENERRKSALIEDKHDKAATRKGIYSQVCCYQECIKKQKLGQSFCIDI